MWSKCHAGLKPITSIVTSWAWSTGKSVTEIRSFVGINDSNDSLHAAAYRYGE